MISKSYPSLENDPISKATSLLGNPSSTYKIMGGRVTFDFRYQKMLQKSHPSSQEKNARTMCHIPGEIENVAVKSSHGETHLQIHLSRHPGADYSESFT